MQYSCQRNGGNIGNGVTCKRPVPTVRLICDINGINVGHRNVWLMKYVCQL